MLRDIQLAYGELTRRFMYAARDKDERLHKRLYDAILLFEELWPDETRAWRDFCASSVKSQLDRQK